MSSSSKYTIDGLYQVDPEEKVVSVPSSVDEVNYPSRVKELINKHKYFKQFNIL